jgi:anti-sigma factor RsiW
MRSCEGVERRLGEMAALPAAELPAGIQEHLAGCPACARALASARLSRGLLAAAADAVEPPAQFVDRVLAAVPTTRGLTVPETPYLLSDSGARDDSGWKDHRCARSIQGFSEHTNLAFP